MQRQSLTTRGMIVLILILQIIPLILFPLDAFSPQSQEWWLPAMLVVMVLVADFEIIVRGGMEVWPWTLMFFAQGLNIISRLMMLWPHAVKSAGGNLVLNLPYIVLTLLSIALSTFILIYGEWPEVRATMVKQPA